MRGRKKAEKEEGRIGKVRRCLYVVSCGSFSALLKM